MSARIRSVCLLTGSDYLAEFMGEALEQMVSGTDATIDLVVNVETEETNSSDGADFIHNLRSRFERRIVNLPESEVKIDEVNCLSNAEITNCKVIPNPRIGVRIPDATVERIDRECDVIIHTGVGILKGDILNATKVGVLSYHHGDLRKYRGSHAGFWEFVNYEDAAGITLQILSPDLDAGQVVAEKQVDITGDKTWGAVKRRLFSESIDMLKCGVQNLNNPNYSAERIPEDQLGKMYYSSDLNLTMRLKYIAVSLHKSIHYTILGNASHSSIEE